MNGKKIQCKNDLIIELHCKLLVFEFDRLASESPILLLAQLVLAAQLLPEGYCNKKLDALFSKLYALNSLYAWNAKQAAVI